MNNIDALMEKIEKLEAENARYREALQTIANGDLAPSLIKEMYIDQAYQTIAEKALKENK